MFAIGQRTRCVLPRLTCASRIRSSTTTSRPTDQLVQTSSPTKQIESKTPNASALWATSETNRLIEHLAARIQAAGPISVADFMGEALTNPKYVRRCFSSPRRRRVRFFLLLRVFTDAKNNSDAKKISSSRRSFGNSTASCSANG